MKTSNARFEGAQGPQAAAGAWRAAACGVAAAIGVAGCGGGGGSSGTGTLPNQAPTVVAKLSGEAVLQATTVFDTTGTSDPDGSIASRSWAYGDGSTGTADSHVYTATGSYTATLTVTDNLGASTSKSVALTVGKCSADGLALAANSPQHSAVCMQTSLGELVIELFPTQAPITVTNFLSYVDEGFYPGTLFHRAEPGFVIQGGGYTSGMVLKTPTHANIALESANGLKNLKYTLAMARGSQAASANTQFFVNLADNAFLDCSACNGTDGYAVFGQVLQATTADAVLNAISSSPTTAVGTPPNVLHIINASSEVVIRSVVRVP